MAIASLESSSNTQTDQNPLLMERIESNSDLEHIVDITRTDDASSTSSRDANPSTETLRSVDRPSSGTETSSRRTALSSSARSNSRSSSFMRRGDGYGHRHRSPLNSGLWISVELVVTVSQIIASFVVLSLARSENPQAPLFAWIVGYASGCIATLPVLYWRFRNRNQSLEQELTHTHQGTSQSNPPEPTSYAAISVSQSSDEENNHATETVGRNGQIAGTLSTRINGLVDHFKMALDCFFAVWFVVGNVWIFGGHSSPADAPKLYRLCIVFLTFSCIGYAMPFILCATICCCLPCIISVLGIREDHSRARGATAEAISALPTYKFKLTKHGSEDNQEVAAKGEDGILAAGTEKERLISGEDAVCCICLAKYTDDDELRELPCIHVFHVECVDKWLKINASCPLCKYEVGESDDTSQFTRDSSHSQQ